MRPRPSGFAGLSRRRWSLYAIQSAYSVDVSNAIENACFFLVPFAVMLMLLPRSAGRRGSSAGSSSP